MGSYMYVLLFLVLGVIPPSFRVTRSYMNVLMTVHQYQKTLATYQLKECHLWAITVVHEPPRSSTDSRKPDVDTNTQVAEEEPGRDKRIRDRAGRFAHDVGVRRVEAEGSSGETVSD